MSIIHVRLQKILAVTGALLCLFAAALHVAAEPDETEPTDEPTTVSEPTEEITTTTTTEIVWTSTEPVDTTVTAEPTTIPTGLTAPQVVTLTLSVEETENELVITVRAVGNGIMNAEVRLNWATGSDFRKTFDNGQAIFPLDRSVEQYTVWVAGFERDGIFYSDAATYYTPHGITAGPTADITKGPTAAKTAETPRATLSTQSGNGEWNNITKVTEPETDESEPADPEETAYTGAEIPIKNKNKPLAIGMIALSVLLLLGAGALIWFFVLRKPAEPGEEGMVALGEETEFPEDIALSAEEMDNLVENMDDSEVFKIDLDDNP
ncbi:MAG: hypothetical protein FWE80_02875 [Oscillospiraceae bacterium]|nr:hypothetical protein [Oscillospiraceae bacterium]